MADDRIQQIRKTIEAYLICFPDVGSKEVLKLIVVPYCYRSEDSVTRLSTEAEFLAFRDAYMSRMSGDVRRGRITEIEVHPIGTAAALADVRSARLDSSGAEKSRGRTRFILCATDAGWRIGAAAVVI